ncbi:hypothetical protein ACOBM3_17090 [Enterobacter hormaechei]|uniref:hypothetical protein n=1 Tax=Enterobacter hormaechei TaxID=158836 RepID=UPI00197E85E5|nr:hypothetical protein [Enterobacter hormaechei]MBN4794986.1 hypothetical protein [Enterobacter hormaechei]MBN4819074.1 hypothetical protein [Enterobacter hormaechei]
MNNNSILIADDQLEKQRSLKNFLENNFNEYTLDSSYSFRSTREKIIKNKYSLILLDMTMPSSDSKTNSDFVSDGKGRALAGSDIIQTMHYRMMDTPVIIVTQFDVFGRHNQLTSIEEITSELLSNYPSIVKGFVLWDYQSDNWNNILLNLINGCLK